MSAGGPVRSTGAAPAVGLVDVVIVAGLVLLAGFAALLGFVWTAWRIDAVPVPIGAVLLPVVLWWISGAVHALTGRVAAAALPWLAALVAVVLLLLAGNPGSTLPLRVVMIDRTANTASDVDWRNLLLAGLLLLGALARLALLAADGVRDRATAAGPGRADDRPV